MSIVNWLKAFWNKSGKQEFLLTHILPIAGLFFTWGCIGHQYTIGLSKEDLTEVDGKIEWIAVVDERSITRSGGTHHPLKIALSGHDDLYKLHDDFKYDFPRIQDSLRVGDNVRLLKRNRMQTFIGMGTRNDIYAIEKNGVTIFGLERMLWLQERGRDIFGFIMIVCWMGYAGHRLGNRKS